MNVLGSTDKLPPIGERVAKGAAALDAEVPGWADRLDPQRVHVNPVTARISVVQDLLAGGYTGSLRTWMVARGFILALADYAEGGFPEAEQVAAWRAEITRRQQHTAAGGGGR